MPPIEVISPTDPNRTRAKPTYDEASTSRRVVPAAAPSTGRTPAAGTGSDVASQSASQGASGNGGRQFSGIVGTASTVITAEEIAHSPAQTLQEIIAQAPGVQLTSLFGGVNGAKTSVDIRGFGAFATSNTLVLINGRRLNDIDMAGVDFSTIPRNSIERIEITRGNSGAVLYGDNAVGGVINIVLKNGVGGPPVAMRAEVGRRLLQSAHGLGFDGAEFGAIVERRSMATPSSPTAIAKTTRSTSATGSAISITPRPTSRPSLR